MIVRNLNDPEVAQTTYRAHVGDTARMILTSHFMKGIEFLAYAFLPKGNTLEAHIDPVEEIYFILQGGGVMRVGNDEKDVGMGDAVWIPAGDIHSLTNNTDEDTVVLVVAAYPR